MREEDVVRLGIDICKALETCHSLGLIHMHVTPDSIYIDSCGDFKLECFDLSDAFNPPSGADRIFTPQYAAPELLSSKDSSSNVDTYSLGLVMYYLLNGGYQPFLPKKQHSFSEYTRYFALTKRLAGEKIPEIPNVDPQLQNVILKACAFKPKNRFPTASAMREALEKIR